MNKDNNGIYSEIGFVTTAFGLVAAAMTLVLNVPRGYEDDRGYERHFSGEIVSIETQEVCAPFYRSEFEKVADSDCTEFMESVTISNGDKTFVASMREDAARILAEDYVHEVGDQVNLHYRTTLLESATNLFEDTVDVEGRVISPYLG